MLTQIILFTISFHAVVSMDIFKELNLNILTTNGITPGFPKPSKANTMNINTTEVNRKVSEAHKRSYSVSDKGIPPKHTCPPLTYTAVEDSDYEDCAKHVKEAAHTYHPDQLKLTPEILEKYGYPFREYRVVTQDSYILTVYRLLGSPKPKNRQAHKTPIYLNHGLSGSSDWWFFLPPEKTLAFMLADDGYDVWIANSRGTSYSLEHEYLDHNKNLSYWDFSFHEMAIYDLPAIIYTMLQETSHKSVLYLGYSMGVTEILICLSEFPEMNSKLKAAFLLGPVAYMGHASNGIRNLANVVENEKAYKALNKAFSGRIRSNVEARKLFKACGADVCVPSAAKCGLCDNVFFAFNGVNALQLNRSALPLIFEKAPNSASVKTLAHFSQLIVSCRFQKFEYSHSQNLKIYKSLRPPVYDVKKITSPIYVYHGQQDNFGWPLDVFDTFRRFKPGVVKKTTLIEDKLFTHLDFVTAKDADKLVYKLVLNDMQSYIDAT